MSTEEVTGKAVGAAAMDRGEGASCSVDALFGGRLTVTQPRKGHRAGTDAVLLAAASGDPGDGTVVDLGAGVGTVGLAIAARCPRVRAVLVEREPALASLARHNCVVNRFDDRVRVIAADVLAPARARHAAGLAPAMADLVVTNPPFYAPGRFRTSPDASRSRAHAMDDGLLDQWMRTAADLLKPRGRLVMIHRPDALALILAVLAGRFGGITLMPVHPRAGQAAVRLLVAAVKGSRSPLSMLPGIALHDEAGRFTAEAEAVHRGDAGLAL
ncbi:tRNA1(Val) (adenine(37)-N6)-methyltransferase [Chelatococcus asaccharovorans]|uniref:tRNA1(Val) A37 N6-methylase TrmN6 n=1 Tax=Chelatococcus asaccharovorans TaxID=28210 RepID=A0A2V3U2L5_9HYPH|nr:tRNA1(Val) A37 N6-methylase TrmN6 [Chelatococcus asaccharovorans]